MKFQYWKPTMLIVLTVLTLVIVVSCAFYTTTLTAWISAICLITGWGVALGVMLRNRHSIKVAIITVIILGAASAILTNPYRVIFLKDTFVTITATGEKNDASYGSEVWLTHFAPDDRPYDLKRYASDEWQLFSTILMTEKGTVTFNLNKYNNLRIQLGAHPVSGIVEIATPAGVERYDLFRAEGETQGLEIDVPFTPLPRDFGCLWVQAFMLVLSAMSAIVVTFSFFYKRARQKKRFLTLLIQLSSGIMLTIIGALILPLSPFFQKWDKLSIFGLTIIVVASFVCCYYAIVREGLRKYIPNGKTAVIFTLISAFCTFLWSYNQIVVSVQDIRLGFHGISLIIISFTVWFSIGISLLFSINFFQARITTAEKRKTWARPEWLLWFCFFVIMGSVWYFWQRALYPATMSPDSIDQWSQAIGLSALHDAHPLFHTMYIRLLASIHQSPAFVAIVQLLMMSALISSMLFWFYRNGVNAKLLLLISCIIAILPTNGVYSITLWKDVPFLLSLLWLSFVIMRIVYKQKITWVLVAESAISLTFVTLFRHNGVVVAVASGFALAVISLKRRSLRVAFGLIGCVALVMFWRGPVYRWLNVTPNRVGLAYTAMSAVGTTIYYGGDIPHDIWEDATANVPVEAWIDYFHPYAAFDYVYNTEYPGAFAGPYYSESPLSIASIWLRLFWENPFLIANERLAMNDTTLFINQSPHEKSLNSRYCAIVLQNDLGIERIENRFTNRMQYLLFGSHNIKLGDMLLWRNGIYIALLIWMIYYSFLYRRLKRALPILPMAINIMSLIISLAEQSFRFTFIIPTLTLFVYLYTALPSLTESDMNCPGLNA